MNFDPFTAFYSLTNEYKAFKVTLEFLIVMSDLVSSTNSVKMYKGPKYNRMYKDSLALSTVIKSQLQ